MIDRIAAAPISWGICEVPGWGLQMPPSRVLGEMAGLGITTTELGALGWLPDDADGAARLARSVRHERARWLRSTGAAPRHSPPRLGRGGARRGEARSPTPAVVTSWPRSSPAWSRGIVRRSTPEWSALFEGLAETEKIVAEYGLVQVVHPHVNTLIETADEFERFLANCASLFTLDTGHLFIGDADPVAIADAAWRPRRPRPRQRCRPRGRGAIPGRRVRLDGCDPARFVPIGWRRRRADR